MGSVGERIPRLDGADKVTGRARYVQDLRLPGLLEAKIKRSPVANGIIRSIDVSAALRIPGVVAVLTADDIPLVPFGYGKDQTPLKRGRVRRVGDEVAAVAAMGVEAAEEAQDAIRVEIEPLPAVFDPERALADGAPLVHEERGTNLVATHEYGHGNVDEGFLRAAATAEGVFHLPAQAHGCLGTAGVVAEWDPQGRLTLYDPTQIPFLLQRDVAAALGIAPSAVRVVQPAIGGGFGARLDLYPYQLVAALLARRAGRPVRVQFDREEEFAVGPVRPKTVVRMRTAAAADGTLLARDADVIVDCGAYVSWGAQTPIVMMHTMGCLYRVPHVRYRGRTVYTNTSPTGAMRGFGNPEITFAIEQQMDEIARTLGIDPIEMRLRNANRPDETTPQGSRITSCGMRECLEAVRARLGPKGAPTAPHRARGVGVASVFHVGGGARIYRSDGCGAMVKVDDFGKVTVIVGGTDIGQGMETAVAQIAAEVLGVAPEQVVVSQSSTDVRPWDVGVHASRTTFIAGNAVRLAAEDARRQIEEGRRATGLPASAPLDKVVRSLHFRDHGNMVLGQAFYDPPNAMVDAKNAGNVSAAYVFGAQGVEVEVDTETGRVEVKRVIAAHDVGRAINPAGVEGQIEGGILQGLGYALLEEVILQDGRVANPSFLDYRMPGPRDVPPIETIIVETNDPEGPFGAKGIGEPPLVPFAAAVANAIADATGVRIRELPMNPERVWRALRSANPSPPRSGGEGQG